MLKDSEVHNDSSNATESNLAKLLTLVETLYPKVEV